MYAKLIEQPPCVLVAIIANRAAAAEGKIRVVANTRVVKCNERGACYWQTVL